MANLQVCPVYSMDNGDEDEALEGIAAKVSKADHKKDIPYILKDKEHSMVIGRETFVR